MSLLNKPVTTSKQNKVNEIHHLAIFTTITSLVFWAFFAWSKTEQFAGVNPFANDPYDAIGSFAFQIAVAISILSLARSFQQRKNLNSLQRSPFIMRGIGIALFVTVITILGDSIAVARQYSMVSSSISGMYLLIGLGALTLLTLINAVLFIKEARLSLRLQSTSNVSSSLGEALNDVYLMILSPLSKIFPKVENIDQWLQKKAQGFEWISPYTHPWRFTLCVGIFLGLLINIAEFIKEGPPAHIQIAFIVTAIFLIGELGAILLGFLLLGSFLGLRPPLFQKNPE